MRANLDVFENPAVLDYTLFSDCPVVTAARIETVLGNLFELLLKRRIIAVLRPHICVCWYDAVERQNISAARFIHYIYRYTNIFCLAVFDNPVAEFGVIGCMHLVDVYKDAPVVDYKMPQVTDIMNRNIVAYITRHNPAVVDTNRKL